MAGFKTHISFSSALGVGYGAVGWWQHDFRWTTSLLAAGLCGVSGMLPDLDSGPGRPLRESTGFAAAVVPLLIAPRLQELRLDAELIIVIGAAVYFLIRFGCARLLAAYTVHRGMFHSLPTMLIFAEAAFLLGYMGDLRTRYYLAGGVTLGFFSHLLLDEIWSVEVYRGRLRLKKSFGTAIKLWGDSAWANLTTYGKLAALSLVVVNDPNWMATVEQRNHLPRFNRPSEQVAADESSRDRSNERQADNAPTPAELVERARRSAGELIDAETRRRGIPSDVVDSVRDRAGRFLREFNRDGAEGSLYDQVRDEVGHVLHPLEESTGEPRSPRFGTPDAQSRRGSQLEAAEGAPIERRGPALWPGERVADEPAPGGWQR